MEDVFRKVERDEGFGGELAVGIYGEGYRGGGAERTAEGNDAEHYCRDPEGGFFLGGPAEAHEAGGGAESDGEAHEQAEFGLVDASVAAGHEADDDVREAAGDGGAEDTANERRQVHQAGLEGGKVVGMVLVDVGYGFGEHNEPADREGVDEGGPED